MIVEKTNPRRVYFEDIQRNWSVLQAGAVQDMIDGLSRHGSDTDPLGEIKQGSAKAA